MDAELERGAGRTLSLVPFLHRLDLALQLLRAVAQRVHAAAWRRYGNDIAMFAQEGGVAGRHVVQEFLGLADEARTVADGKTGGDGQLLHERDAVVLVDVIG